MGDEDPFDCFGDDESDEEPVSSVHQLHAEDCAADVKRDAQFGILAFHAGTEQALLAHVARAVPTYNEDGGGRDLGGLVLRSIDDFSLTRHWMMHVGTEKGETLVGFLQECVDANSKSEGCLSVVELGSYCGYSSILLANYLAKIGQKNFHVWSVEVVDAHAKVAREMVKLAGLERQISVLLLDTGKETLESLLKPRVGVAEKIHFLFIDHDKSLYLSDLQRLEAAGLVRNGTFVAADNVVFARIHDYRQYISDHAKRHIVSTKLVEGWLQYCEPDHGNDAAKKELMKDGIELTVYLADPI